MPRNPTKIWSDALWRGTRLLMSEARDAEERLEKIWSRAIRETLRAKYGSHASRAITTWQELTPEARVARLHGGPRSFENFRGTILEALGSLRFSSTSPGLPPS